MLRSDARVEQVSLYPKAHRLPKFIDGLAVLVGLDIKVAVFDPEFFVFLSRPLNRVKILY